MVVAAFLVIVDNCTWYDLTPYNNDNKSPCNSQY